MATLLGNTVKGVLRDHDDKTLKFLPTLHAAHQTATTLFVALQPYNADGWLDMKLLQDHYAPGSGDLNFDLLKPFIKADQCKVVEAHNRSTSEEVSRAIPFLSEKGF